MKLYTKWFFKQAWKDKNISIRIASKIPAMMSAQDEHGHTLLMITVFRGNLKGFKILRKAGSPMLENYGTDSLSKGTSWYNKEGRLCHAALPWMGIGNECKYPYYIMLRSWNHEIFKWDMLFNEKLGFYDEVTVHVERILRPQRVRLGIFSLEMGDRVPRLWELETVYEFRPGLLPAHLRATMYLTDDAIITIDDVTSAPETVSVIEWLEAKCLEETKTCPKYLELVDIYSA